MNARKAENMIKRLISFRGKEDCWAKATDIEWKMNKKMKFGLGNKDTWCTLSSDVEKIINSPG